MENFEELLQKELGSLPYNKHLDDGQFNDGQQVGFELGARWAFKLLTVSKPSEQLQDYFKWHKEQGYVSHKDSDIDEFLANNSK